MSYSIWLADYKFDAKHPHEAGVVVKTNIPSFDVAELYIVEELFPDPMYAEVGSNGLMFFIVDNDYNVIEPPGINWINLLKEHIRNRQGKVLS